MHVRNLFTAVGYLFALLASYNGVRAQERTDTTYQMDDVIVSVSKIETRDLSVPAIVFVKTLTDLQKPGEKNYFDLLSKEPGIKINARRDNATQNDIDIRGLSGNATSGTNLLIMLDGIPQRRLSYGGPYLGALPFAAVTRMELMKGPASSLYGRFALAGVLQLTTTPVSDRMSGKIFTGYDDLTGGVQTALQLSGAITPKLVTSLTVNTSASDGWQPYSGTKRKEAYMNTGYALGEESALRVIAGRIDAYEETVAPVLIDSVGKLLKGFTRSTNIAVPNQNNLSLEENRIAAIWTQRLSTQLSFDLKSSYWNADTHFNVGRPDDQPASGPKVARSASIRDWNEYTIFNEAEASYKGVPIENVGVSAIAGGSFEKLHWYQRQTNIGIAGTSQNIPLDLATMTEPAPQSWIYSVQPDKVTDETDYGMFVRTQLSLLHSVDIHAGIRYDGFTRRQFDPKLPNVVMELADDAVSPNIGCSIQLYRSEESRIGVYGNYGKGFSPIYRAVGSTAFASVVPEISRNYELGAKSFFLGNLLSMNAAFFSISRLNIVLTNPVTNLPENGGQWDIEGIEIGVGINPHPNYAFYGNAAVSSSDIKKDINNPGNAGNKIPLNAGMIFSAGCEVRDLILWDRAQATVAAGGTLDYQYVSKRYGNEANSFILPAYQLLNATATLQWNKRLQFGLFVKNILDEFYYTTVFTSVKKGSAFTGMPRSYGLSCQISIGASD
jgi:iron complex outermembrane recepter protein